MANNAINSLTYGSNTYIFTLPYGTCSTAAGTAAKAVTVDKFSLETGAVVAVKFTYANTAANPTLNVNSTGAKAIYQGGAAIAASAITANTVYELVYNGTQWDLIKGLKGDTGATGATGAQGPQGNPGTNGTTPTIKAANGTNVSSVGTPNVTASTSGTTTTFTFNYLKGAKGDKGDKGDPGVNATTTAVVSTTANGLAPKRDGSTTKFLRGDGTWAVPPDTNTDTNTSHSHSAGVGLTGSGSAGTGSGTYTYKAKLRSETKLTVDSAAATTTSGRVYPVAVDKTGYLAVNVPWTDNNTVYTHPSHTAKSSGLYKITVDSSGHVSAATAVAKSDITALGIPGSDTNTTYSAGTGISFSGTTINNSGVRSIATGTANGTISVNTNGTAANVSVKGLGSAAYTASTAYATAAQGTKADNAMPKSGGTFTDTVKFNTAATFSSGADFNYDVTAKRITIDNNYAIRWNSSDNNSEPIALLLDKTDDLLLGAPSSSVPHAGNTYIYAANGDIALRAGSDSVYICTEGKGHATENYQTLVWTTNGNSRSYLKCAQNDGAQLGGSNYKWKSVYATTGTVQTSDRNAKKNIQDMDDRYVQLFDLVRPVTYMLLNGDRIHTGFIAQEVEEAMEKVGLTAEDLGFFCRDIKTKEVFDENGKMHEEDVLDENGNPVYIYSLRYEEYIAIMAEKVRRLEAKYNERLAKLDEIDARLAKLEDRLN